MVRKVYGLDEKIQLAGRSTTIREQWQRGKAREMRLGEGASLDKGRSVIGSPSKSKRTRSARRNSTSRRQITKRTGDEAKSVALHAVSEGAR
jgi:hypothetical protein